MALRKMMLKQSNQGQETIILDVHLGFVLGLGFENLKMFKNALADFSTRERLEFKYIKNDKLRE